MLKHRREITGIDCQIELHVQVHVWTYVVAILMVLTLRKLVFFIANFRAVLNPVINITVFGEIVKFAMPNL